MVFVNKTRKHEVKIKVKKRGAGSAFCSYAINIISFNQLFHAAKYNLTTMGGMRKRTDVLFTAYSPGDWSAVLSLQGLIRTLFTGLLDLLLDVWGQNLVISSLLWIKFLDAFIALNRKGK